MNNPILVTGAHRSGSTWMGNIVCTSPQVKYIHEPFNIGIERDNMPFIYWFEYVDLESNKDYQLKVKSYLESFYKLFHTKSLEKIRHAKSLNDIRNALYEWKGRYFRRPLIKDPIAVMSAEWLYKKLNYDVIISIRHPAAFVASLKVKDWQFNFDNFLSQDLLMQNQLSDFRNEIKDLRNDNANIVMQGIGLWNAIYTVVDHYKTKYNGIWYFVRNEDLSQNPIDEFRNIFEFLDIPFDEAVRTRIVESTNANQNTSTKRNSIENIGTWKNRLSVEEITLIKEKTATLWPKFYSEDDWN